MIKRTLIESQRRYELENTQNNWNASVTVSWAPHGDPVATISSHPGKRVIARAVKVGDGRKWMVSGDITATLADILEYLNTTLKPNSIL